MAYTAPPPAYHQTYASMGMGMASGAGMDMGYAMNSITNPNPLTDLSGQLALLVHASFRASNSVSDPSRKGEDMSATVNFALEAAAFEKIKNVILKCAEGCPAQVGDDSSSVGLEVRSVFPWKINHSIRLTTGGGKANSNSEGEGPNRGPNVATLGSKTGRDEQLVAASEPCFPIAERDGYATVALVVSISSDPSGTIIPHIGETLKSIRVQQVLNAALSASSQKTSSSSSTVLIDSVGFISVALADELLTRSFAPVNIKKDDLAKGKGGLRTEPSEADSSASSVAAALEDKMCAVLVEGFLDAVPVDGSSSTFTVCEEKLSTHLVPLTMRETVPMLEAYMRQTYGARLVVLHPASARDAFLLGDGAENPLGSAACSLSDKLSALLNNPAAALTLDPAQNPFTVHCFFDFSASTVLARPSSATPSSTVEPVNGIGKMFLAFSPSHPQAEDYSAHLSATLQAQKVFNGNPIRVNRINGKQFVRALRRVKEIGGQ